MAATVVAVGLLVGSLVAAASGGIGAGMCGPDLQGECHALARSFALRTGLMVGLVTVLMQLIVAGLLRMVAEEESRRLEREGVWE